MQNCVTSTQFTSIWVILFLHLVKRWQYIWASQWGGGELALLFLSTSGWFGRDRREIEVLGGRELKERQKTSRVPGGRFRGGIIFSILRTNPKTPIPESSSPVVRRQAVQLALVNNDSVECLQTRSWWQESFRSIEKTERVERFCVRGRDWMSSPRFHWKQTTERGAEPTRPESQPFVSITRPSFRLYVLHHLGQARKRLRCPPKPGIEYQTYKSPRKFRCLDRRSTGSKEMTNLAIAPEGGCHFLCWPSVLNQDQFRW